MSLDLVPRQREVLLPAPRIASDQLAAGEIVGDRPIENLLLRLATHAGDLRRMASRAKHRARHRPPRQRVARIVCFVPAHNEEADIARTLDSLLTQTRRIDRIVVIADNCTDNTERIAGRYKGVTVMRTVNNVDKKVGALTQGWQRWSHGYDFILGVDADTVLAPDCVAELEDEMVRNRNAAGVMARYTFDEKLATSWWARQLIRAQRIDFASWLTDIMSKERETYVLGGQATLFRTSHLAQVANTHERNSPWDPDAQVEDMELTWRLHEAGKQTMVSASARAYAGPMLTVKALLGQRRKWDEGMIRLLLKNGFTKNTWLPWKQQFAMFTDGIIRLALLVLLGAALAVEQYVWAWLWAVPPVLAILLNIKTAWRVPGRRPGDLLFALLLFPAEMWLCFRIWCTTTSWVNVVAGRKRDGWEAQKAAEAGRSSGGMGKIIGWSLAVSAATVVLAYWWLTIASAHVQEKVLTIGWGALAVLTLARVLSVVIKLFKPTRGYKP